MDKPWYRKMFGSPTPTLNSTLSSAETGDAEAQFALGLKYANCTGQGQDYLQATQWYRKAADQNHCLAQFNLAIMYAKGQGVPQDDAEALKWIQKAACGGDAGAQYNLGIRCHRSSLAPVEKQGLESRIEAYKWLHLAAVQGYIGSETACQRLILTMTKEEFATANQRADAFLANRPNPPIP